MTIKFPKYIKGTYHGLKLITSVWHKAKDAFIEDVIIDFSQCEWFEANYTAILGGIIDKIEAGLNNVYLKNISPVLQNILQRNEFLYSFGYEKLPDINETVLKYHKFKLSEGTLFKNYINDELLSKKDFPNISEGLAKKINENLFELFENARIHGETDFIYCCGQYYPTTKHPRIDLTIVDTGKTIKGKVNEFLNKGYTGNEAIEWALQGNNTTKTGNISGGLGLKLILEFLELNKGKIQILSSDGYWGSGINKSTSKTIPFEFPGTIVNIEFNLNDPYSYKLKSEISLVDIF